MELINSCIECSNMNLYVYIDIKGYVFRIVKKDTEIFSIFFSGNKNIYI